MKVGIVMGSKSDYPVVERAEKVLTDFGVEFETRIISAHRTPVAAMEFASKAEENGIEVIIAAAGKAAHLGGVLAAFTPMPVIGLPVKSSTLTGLGFASVYRSDAERRPCRDSSHRWCGKRRYSCGSDAVFKISGTETGGERL